MNTDSISYKIGEAIGIAVAALIFIGGAAFMLAVFVRAVQAVSG